MVVRVTGKLCSGMCGVMIAVYELGGIRVWHPYYGAVLLFTGESHQKCGTVVWHSGMEWYSTVIGGGAVCTDWPFLPMAEEDSSQCREHQDLVNIWLQKYLENI